MGGLEPGGLGGDICRRKADACGFRNGDGSGAETEAETVAEAGAEMETEAETEAHANTECVSSLFIYR